MVKKKSMNSFFFFKQFIKASLIRIIFMWSQKKVAEQNFIWLEQKRCYGVSAHLSHGHLFRFALKQVFKFSRVKFDRFKSGPEWLLAAFVVTGDPVGGADFTPEQADGLLPLLEERRLLRLLLRRGRSLDGEAGRGRRHTDAEHGRGRRTAEHRGGAGRLKGPGGGGGGGASRSPELYKLPESRTSWSSSSPRSVKSMSPMRRDPADSLHQLVPDAVRLLLRRRSRRRSFLRFY